ncbi:RDD family protein [Tumidithrix helvetica PCC 7403]|uniref:RDD family protein n=1 Tax=Tumidithrix helvetica TaxID=3457545 RepID=UPI003CC3E052
MMDFDPAYNRLAIAQLPQRIGATLIDFVACEFLSQLIQALIWNNNDGSLNTFIFAPVWFLFRVLVSSKAQGQSFGRWLMSIRVVDMNYGKTSGIVDLLKREAVIFLGLVILLSTFTTTLIVFAWLPLAVDIIFAIADPVKRQMLHDRLGGTIVIMSRKGFELDRKLSKLFGQVGQRTTQLYQDRYGGRDDDLDYQPRNSNRSQTHSQTRSQPRSQKQTRYPEDAYGDEERSRPPSRVRRPRRRR